jgi:glycosyltransferase involved in cell wall biosynthesis
LEGKVQGNSRSRVYAKFLVEKFVYRNQTIMTTHSNAFKQVLIEEFQIPEQKIHVVYPGVDLDKFRPRDKVQARQVFGIKGDQKVLLCIRRLEPRMGINLAIDAIEHLRDCVLVIAGTGSLDESLRNYANSKPYRDRIRFLGVVDEANHSLIYNASDLVVVPTLSFEGFGLVVWEAFASGVPVVASQVGGLTEALGEFAEEYSFKTGSVEDLVKKIKFALSTQKHAETFTSAVRNRTWRNTALEIEAIVSRTYGSLD